MTTQCLLNWTVSPCLYSWGHVPRTRISRQWPSLKLRSFAQSWRCWGAGEAVDFSGTPGPRKEPSLPPGTGTLMGPVAAVPAHTQSGHPHDSNEEGGSWWTHATEVPCPSSPEPGQGEQTPRQRPCQAAGSGAPRTLHQNTPSRKPSWIDQRREEMISALLSSPWIWKPRGHSHPPSPTAVTS